MHTIKKIVTILVLLGPSCCNLNPGSYPYAEEYEINTKEHTLIEAIQDFKRDNSQFNVPESVQLKDGRNNDKDHWYHVYFYYPQENHIVYAWTRPLNKHKTIFAFVSVNEGLTLGNWKEINHDFDRSDNMRQKKLFEERILGKLKNAVE